MKLKINKYQCITSKIINKSKISINFSPHFSTSQKISNTKN
ncbi:hypothetical protein yberc0001_3070 [Yersinia bercovieri ATCC 43970]|uniref:Uncharacterized protein n=1 Tax=Yersinia bercovieri ATCC 43970 TaxID=349968 RepID=A0ABP2E9S9_YERBE|nr:hypothetical protein yberc0001_3070 [Yersinia bercovieri ATCC 43970]